MQCTDGIQKSGSKHIHHGRKPFQRAQMLFRKKWSHPQILHLEVRTLFTRACSCQQPRAQAATNGGQSRHKDLHTATKTQHEVEGGLGLDVVVRKGATILRLLAGEGQRTSSSCSPASDQVGCLLVLDVDGVKALSKSSQRSAGLAEQHQLIWRMRAFPLRQGR